MQQETVTREPSTPSEMEQLALILNRRFMQRWDLYPRQLEDGRYVCVHQCLTHDLLLQHLRGEVTLGAYVLDEESMGRYLVFDADDDLEWISLEALAMALDEIGTTAYLEKSRRGGHLWLFFERDISGVEIRRFGQGLMIYYGLGSLELFPKQARLTGGPGSLIRLPFGVHRRSGRRYGFYLPNGQPLAPTLREQIRRLEVPMTVPGKAIQLFSEHAPSRRNETSSSLPSESNSEDERSQFERIKQAISARDFIGRYVDLAPNGSGLCPFHSDHVESFSVNDEHNYWKCFACDKAGSIIDFWMYYRECDFNTAVNQLANMLL